jgi:hypothetical protein
VADAAIPNPLLVPLSGTATAAVPCPNNSLLSGNYAVMLNGWTSASTASSIVGSFVADGAGNVSSATFDTADQAKSAPKTNTFTGTYCAGSNNLASINLTNTDGLGGTANFEAALDSSDGNGHIIGYASSMPLISGLLRKQTTSAFSTGAFKGNYAFGYVGADPSANRFAMAGEFNSDGRGNLSGVYDADDNGSLQTDEAFTSNDFTVASSGRGTLTIATASNGNLNYVFYVVSASEALVMAVDTETPPVILAGQVLQQSGTFSDASLDGVGVIESQCLQPGGGPVASVGLVTATGTGATWTSTGDVNHWGTLETQTGSGTFSVASNGRLTGLGSSVLYLVAANQAFSVGTNNAVCFGTQAPQTGSDFTNTSLSGLYLGGTQQPVDWNVSAHAEAGQADGNGNLTFTDYMDSGGEPSGPKSTSTTYVVSSDGRVVVSVNGTEAVILYMVSASQFVAMDATSSNPKLQDFHQ